MIEFAATLYAIGKAIELAIFLGFVGLIGIILLGAWLDRLHHPD